MPCCGSPLPALAGCWRGSRPWSGGGSGVGTGSQPRPGNGPRSIHAGQARVPARHRGPPPAVQGAGQLMPAAARRDWPPHRPTAPPSALPQRTLARTPAGRRAPAPAAAPEAGGPGQATASRLPPRPRRQRPGRELQAEEDAFGEVRRIRGICPHTRGSAAGKTAWACGFADVTRESPRGGVGWLSSSFVSC